MSPAVGYWWGIGAKSAALMSSLLKQQNPNITTYDKVINSIERFDFYFNDCTHDCQ